MKVRFFEILYQICKVNKINMCTMFSLVMYIPCYMIHRQNARVYRKVLYFSILPRHSLCWPINVTTRPVPRSETFEIGVLWQNLNLEAAVDHKKYDGYV